ncbi:unnamed protein product (macronuclear) [Paramecium tetraurelia]|uniref:Protein FRA10AC1 n=1 Tax=Paramecium tetraurelia TaxID=5888 RepID=A0CJK7_PARTE|nr:uncharacterized protein GSPATT00000686001 [Paramecium tetraurelia]CAK70974.1 unnamed protein product [Paramecium tetraurelia]|eukprot:XP_001438371.1 hypothetical protein (macronuclear) [Paramecium tetraurelia strain d4-2]
MNKDQKPQKPLPKSDMEVLKQYHQFVRDDEEDIDPKLSTNDDYGRMIARKYYDKLYKEYAIIDLSQYKTGKIGMRWRTEPEVLSGKGETICGNKVCTKDKELSTWELNFQYKENQEVKNTLVKVKCCNSCSQQLNYKKLHKQVKEYTEEEIRHLLAKLEEKKKKLKQEEDS